MNKILSRYKARPGHFFDVNTPIFLIADFRKENGKGWFEGRHSGIVYTEMFPYEDFDYVGEEEILEGYRY